jgi:hypothetical protein
MHETCHPLPDSYGAKIPLIDTQGHRFIRAIPKKDLNAATTRRISQNITSCRQSVFIHLRPLMPLPLIPLTKY